MTTPTDLYNYDAPAEEYVAEDVATDTVETETAEEQPRKRDKMPDMSFLTSVKPKRTELSETPRGRTAEPNPAAALFEKSAKSGKAYQIPCEAGQGKYVERLLRRAAQEYEGEHKWGSAPEVPLGVTVQFFDANDENVMYPGREVINGQLPYDKQINVGYQAKLRRKQNRNSDETADQN